MRQGDLKATVHVCDLNVGLTGSNFPLQLVLQRCKRKSMPNYKGNLIHEKSGQGLFMLVVTYFSSCDNSVGRIL